jgi:hypothetical protein
MRQRHGKAILAGLMINLALIAVQAVCRAQKQSNFNFSFGLSYVDVHSCRQSKVLPSTVNDIESDRLEEKLTQRSADRTVFDFLKC